MIIARGTERVARPGLSQVLTLRMRSTHLHKWSESGGRMVSQSKMQVLSPEAGMDTNVRYIYRLFRVDLKTRFLCFNRTILYKLIFQTQESY